MKRAAAIVVASLVVIAAAWWWHHRGGTAADPAIAAGSGSAGSVAIAPADRTARVEATDSTVILADDDPRGTLRLEGMVLGPDDHPVGGATVTISANPPRTATTEADGGFVFEALVGRTYSLVARAPAGIAGPITTRITEKTEPIVLRLRAGGKLAVTVVGGDAKPFDGATVELRGIDRQTASTTAGVATFDPVVPGLYEVAAWAPGMAKSYRIVRVVGSTTARIVLAAGAAVAGRVVDESGTPIAGARVIFLAAGELVQAQADARADSVTSGSDGTWRFAALPAGSVRFRASDDNHASGTSGLITLDGVNEKTGVVVTMTAGATVRGRVVDVHKQPVAGARVQIAEAGRGGGGGRGGRGARGPGGRQPSRQGYSDEQGEFAIRGVARGELVATASHDAGASSGVDVDTTAGDAKIEITLDLTATIAGVVVDPEGQPIEGAQVTAFGQSAADGARARASFNTEVSDAQGHFRIGGLSPGVYKLRASRSAIARSGGRGRRGGEGVDASTGTDNVKLVLPAEGGLKGKVVFADGTTPLVYTVSVGGAQQSFVTGDFEVDALAPGDYELLVRGPTFDSRGQDVTIEPSAIADVGTLTVSAGRRIAGVVTSNGQPVAGATVYAGRQVMGGGATSESPTAAFSDALGAGTKQDTTDASGAFSLAGFGDIDLTVIADLPAVGRSKALLVPDGAPNQTNLVLDLQPYGSLSGVLRQGGQPAAGVAVTVQSTTTPGAVNLVLAGADGAYRFDRLAPDTYKVSATLGTLRRGIHQYSQQVDVPAGRNVTVDLVVDPGTVTVDVTPVAANGPVGMAIAYLASTALTATTSSALSLQLAGAGPGASQVTIVRSGEPAQFSAVTPGAYSTCIVALPVEIRGPAAIAYFDRHGSKLAAVCKAITVAPSPDTQPFSVPVAIPPLISDPASGSGSH